MLGALQFAPSLRRRRWHRLAGRVLVPAGLLSALSALWMTLFYDLPASNGAALLVMRLVFGTAMAAGIVVAFVAIRRGDVATHSAWMTRAYAIGLGAGTQVFTFLPWTLVFGAPDVADARGAHGRRLGDQPRRRRGRHPATGRALRSPRRVPPPRPVRRVRTYHEGMTSPVRSLWDAPAAVAAAAAARLAGLGARRACSRCVALFEAAVRPDDVPWRWLWAVVLIALVPTLLWRRTHPLLDARDRVRRRRRSSAS